jgi:pimeloyl-ACP methyl ester carboxylesterase
MKTSRSEFHAIRGLRYHVRIWGDPAAPRLFLLHGWMDVSASFQFLVDSFAREWCAIAPDWRGFGLTEWAREGYWFPDYYADLEALLDHYQPDEPVRIIGHSMGGVIGSVYAGVRPERVARLVSLEGLGLARHSPDQAPARYGQWLGQLKETPAFRPYRSFDEVAARLRKNNPRLSEERAAFLARHWAKRLDLGDRAGERPAAQARQPLPVPDRGGNRVLAADHRARAGLGQAVGDGFAHEGLAGAARRAQAGLPQPPRDRARHRRPHDAPRPAGAAGANHRGVP